MKFKGGKLNMKNYVIVFDQLYGKEIKLNMAMVSIIDIRSMDNQRFTIVRYVSEAWGGLICGLEVKVNIL